MGGNTTLGMKIPLLPVMRGNIYLVMRKPALPRPFYVAAEHFGTLRTAGEVAARPPGGWLKSARQAGEASQQQLARKLGTKRQAWAQLEASEAREAISLYSLRRAAEVMGYDLVYFLVPRAGRQEGAVAAPAVESAHPLTTGEAEPVAVKPPAGATPAWADGELPMELR